jgi:hypothetical protein
MSELVANCPRCGAKAMTFDLVNQIPIHIRYDWQAWFEAFCVCRACNKSTIFVLSQKDIHDKEEIKKGLSKLDRAVNQVMKVESHISLKDAATQQPPEHLPKNIEAAFREGAACMSIGCYNAGGTMFRLCIDLATRAMLPEGDAEGLNAKTRRDLGLRLPWLFDNGVLPEALRELSACIKEDGNDGAHQGTLGEEDAGDILDFTYVLLERLYTEPKRIEIAKERRTARREGKS